MPSPVEIAQALTPQWMMEILKFDGLEIHPCRTETDRDGTSFVEQCEPDQAEIWSVYGHLKTGGVECFEDFASEQEARVFAEKTLAAYPHLRTFGLMG